MREVIIVGGGPTGCLVARELAKSHDVVVMEEHGEIGSPLQCMGLVSARVLDFISPGKRGELIESLITHGKITSPGGDEYILDFDEPKAYVIDRVGFDRALAEEAMDAGAQFKLGSRIERIGSSKGLRVELKDVVEKADLLIGADGPHSLVRRTFFPKSETEIEFIRCYGAELDAKIASEEECAHVFLGNDVAPSFFAWTLPLRQGARVGLGVSGRKPYPYFRDLMDRFGDGITRRIGGEIPVGLLPSFSSGDVALVGDACCQVKPISGGGLFPGLTGALLCSKSIIEGKLESYRERWMKEMGKEISGSLRLRGLYKKLSDSDVREIFSLVKENDKIKSTLAKYGDLDYQYRSVTHVAKSLGPRDMLSLTRALVKAFLRRQNKG